MRTIHPAIIEEDRKRRERERQPVQVPLYDHPTPPGQIPPGWEPDPNNRGGYRRIEDDWDSDGNSDRGVVIIQM